jgi:nucleoid DNA-binding protein
MGEVQAAIARAAIDGLENLRARAAEERATESAMPAEEAVVDEAPIEHTFVEEQPVEEEEPSEGESAATEQADSADDPVTAELVKIISNRLAAGESVTLNGIGVLDVHHETSRIVHDERGRTIVEPPKRTPAFNPSPPDDAAE